MLASTIDSITKLLERTVTANFKYLQLLVLASSFEILRRFSLGSFKIHFLEIFWNERERDREIVYFVFHFLRFFHRRKFSSSFGKKDTLVKNTRHAGYYLGKGEEDFQYLCARIKTSRQMYNRLRSPIPGNSGHPPLYRGKSCHEGNIVEFVKTSDKSAERKKFRKNLGRNGTTVIRIVSSLWDHRCSYVPRNSSKKCILATRLRVLHFGFFGRCNNRIEREYKSFNAWTRMMNGRCGG